MCEALVTNHIQTPCQSSPSYPTHLPPGLQTPPGVCMPVWQDQTMESHSLHLNYQGNISFLSNLAPRQPRGSGLSGDPLAAGGRCLPHSHGPGGRQDFCMWKVYKSLIVQTLAKLVICYEQPFFLMPVAVWYMSGILQLACLLASLLGTPDRSPASVWVESINDVVVWQ